MPDIAPWWIQIGLEGFIAFIGVITLFLTWGILRKMQLFDNLFIQIKTVIESNTDAMKSSKEVDKQMASTLRDIEIKHIEDSKDIKNKLDNVHETAKEIKNEKRVRSLQEETRR